MRYKNKIDWWIALVLLLCVLMFVPLLWFIPAEEQWILVVSMAVMAVIVLPFLYGYCELGEEELILRLGYIRYKVRYENIKSIRLTTSFLSSMAMTTKRIEIREHNKSYLRGTTHFGPVDREEFAEELAYRCPNLEDRAKIEE
jgi:hypothetical protein